MNPYTADLLDVVRELAEVDPVGHSREGLDDECIFCGAWYEHLGEPYADCYHHDGCTWVAARKLLGLPAATADQRPGSIHGPPVPDQLLSPLELALRQHEREIIKQLTQPLWYERAADLEDLAGLQRGYNDARRQYVTIQVSGEVTR